jgi:hypothetical protein
MLPAHTMKKTSALVIHTILQSGACAQAKVKKSLYLCKNCGVQFEYITPYYGYEWVKLETADGKEVAWLPPNAYLDILHRMDNSIEISKELPMKKLQFILPFLGDHLPRSPSGEKYFLSQCRAICPDCSRDGDLVLVAEDQLVIRAKA